MYLPTLRAIASRTSLAITFILVAAVGVAYSGTVDPTFGTAGSVVTDVQHNDAAYRLFVLSDGKILAVGQTWVAGFHLLQESELLVRYNSDGSLDTTFGNGGKVAASSSLAVHDALVQPDGKIVIAGGFFPEWNMPPDDFGIARYNANGTLDTTFGVNGYVRTSFGGGREWIGGIVLLPGGKLMAFGATQGSQTTAGTIDMARYNPDGSLDTTFGNGGTLFQLYGEINSTPGIGQTLLLPDGKFLTLSSNALFRFNSDGSFDATFDGDGVAQNFSSAKYFVRQPDGKYVIALRDNNGNAFLITRRNVDGSVDPGFGVNGTASIRFRKPTPGYYSVNISQVAVASNGDIYAVGSSAGFTVVRLDPNGNLLAKTIIPVNSSNVGSAGCLAFQADGKLVVGGGITPFESDLALMRLMAVTNDFRPYKHPYDYDGDGSDDIAVYRPGTGGNNSVWINMNVSTPYPLFGVQGDLIVPHDYNGDGQTDYALFRPSNGAWYIATEKYLIPTFSTTFWGTTGDVPAAADYDGDGTADIAVYRPSSGTWYIQTNQGAGYQAVAWGIAEDRPMPGDYDGDGKADIAVYRPSTGYWYVLRSSNGLTSAVQLGASGDLPMSGDFDGDTKADYAVYRPSNGTWFYLASGTGSFNAVYWGSAGDVAAPGDYDGDNKTDAAIYRPSTGFWYILRSTNGAMISQKWGIATDIPIPGN
jgi:uncharacterized delta-60 repeat protein